MNSSVLYSGGRIVALTRERYTKRPPLLRRSHMGDRPVRRAARKALKEFLASDFGGHGSNHKRPVLAYRWRAQNAHEKSISCLELGNMVSWALL